MKKLWVLLILVFFMLPQMTLANGPMRIGGNANVVLPTGNFGDVAGTGFGATGIFIYPFNDNISFTGHVGYISFGGQTIEGFNSSTDYSYSLIPILGGARYYFVEAGDGPRWFGGGQVGLQRFSFETTTTSDNVFFGNNTFSASSTDFAVGASGGVEINNIDVSAVFMISDFNYVGVRVGYTVPFGE